MGRRSRARGRNIGLVVLSGLAVAAWLGCAAESSVDPNADDGTGTSSGTTATAKPTSTRPEFEASFPETDGGGTTTNPDGGTEGGGGGPGSGCTDPNDVGSSEPTAKDLGTITDKDSDGSSVKGVVNGAVDVDYYKFVGTDTITGVVDPTLEAVQPTSGVEMCMFVSCLKGTGIDFKGCSDQGVQKTSGLGNPGCCFTAPGKTTLDYNCLGTSSESATVFMRFQQTANACTPYQANYHF